MIGSHFNFLASHDPKTTENERKIINGFDSNILGSFSVLRISNLAKSLYNYEYAYIDKHESHSQVALNTEVLTTYLRIVSFLFSLNS